MPIKYYTTLQFSALKWRGIIKLMKVSYGGLVEPPRCCDNLYQSQYMTSEALYHNYRNAISVPMGPQPKKKLVSNLPGTLDITCLNGPSIFLSDFSAMKARNLKISSKLCLVRTQEMYIGPNSFLS